MKKTARYIIALLSIMALLLVACGQKKEYYEDTDIKNLETFTSITGIELNIVKDSNIGKTYNYMLDNTATGIGAITKYLDYIEKSGFVKDSNINQEYGNDTTSYYIKDGFIITVFQETFSSNTLQFAVHIPTKSVIDDSEPQNNTEK